MELRKLNKLRKTLNGKVGSAYLILIPHWVTQRCIIAAKTSEAKQRLVTLALEATIEDMKRGWVPSYPHYQSRPHPVVNKKSLMNRIKGIFNVS